VTIYTIGVGDPEANGDYRVDLATLREVAARTQGQFFRAEDGAQLEAIYADIDRLAPVKLQSFTWRPRVPMFQWPLGARVVIALLLWTVLLITRGHALARTARHA
jgi:Ca-activated chloride channel family protein